MNLIKLNLRDNIYIYKIYNISIVTQINILKYNLILQKLYTIYIFKNNISRHFILVAYAIFTS